MKYKIITYGCQMNKSDSERIAAILEKQGYQPASKENEADLSAEALAKADLIVVNMCSVRQSAVDRVYGLAAKFKKLKTIKPKLKTLLTGCISNSDYKKFQNFFDYVLSIKALNNWPEFLKEDKYFYYPNPRDEKFVNEFKAEYLKEKSKSQKDFSAFVPISTGCDNFCTFCIVPYVRGPLICRNHEDVLEEVKEAIGKGAKEIWLLGQNVNDYRDKVKNQKSKVKTTTQKSKVINFSKLLQLIDKIPGDFKFFFTSPHPKNFSDKLIDTLAKCQKFGKLLNLPVQSGDDEILRKMKRNYTVEEYKNLVEKIKKKIPDIKLSTDVIVGFPGETKEQFKNTVKLLKEIKFYNAYIAKYSPRPGTAAFQMKDDVPLKEKKRREKILRDILKSIH